MHRDGTKFANRGMNFEIDEAGEPDREERIGSVSQQPVQLPEDLLGLSDNI